MFEGLITRDDVASIAASEQLTLDDEDRISILRSMRSIDVQACPGSGKTTLIATKLILLAKKWPLSHQGVCVLSHTNVAKDQIIDRIERSNSVEAQRLVSYPHFIGTIQEFVNRFLALPHIRSGGVSDVIIDNDEYVRVARKLLERNQFSWFRGTLNGLGDSSSQESFLRMTFRLCSTNGNEVNIDRKPSAWRQSNNLQRAQVALERLKQYLDERGFFLFRDMYTHGQIACSLNEELPSAVRRRFPCVLIDEMQDTQKFQDEILRNVFHLDTEESIVQRFGDPDQAIFHGTGHEEPNTSFNDKSATDMDFVVHKSHRFDDQLAHKIKFLSHNEIPLETELSESALVDRSKVHSEESCFEHSVIIFDDDSRDSVIPTFAEIVSCQFEEEYKCARQFVAKVVGAVGNDIDPTDLNQMKIGHYWKEYDKVKSKSIFKEESLIEAVRYCRQASTSDWADSYKFLFTCVVKILRMTGNKNGDGRYFSAATLQKHLKSSDEWESFREIIHTLLSDSYLIDQMFWDETCRALTTILGLQNIPPDTVQYFAYANETTQLEIGHGSAENDERLIIPLPENTLAHPDGFRIELSTIHGVKGETHDATLILPTKYHRNDLEVMLPYFAGELPKSDLRNSSLRDTPHHSARIPQNKKFLRQLYVAASRPRHLLCLAIHDDHIGPEQRTKLSGMGWKLRPLNSDSSD